MIASNYIYHITTTSQELGHFIKHQAIAFDNDNQTYVLHMTFEGIELTTLEALLKTRKLLSKHKYELKQDVNIDDILLNYKGDKFDLINNNCETFTADFINTYTKHHCPRISKTVVRVAIMIAIAVIIIYKIKN